MDRWMGFKVVGAGQYTQIVGADDVGSRECITNKIVLVSKPLVEGHDEALDIGAFFIALIAIKREDCALKRC